MKKKETWEGLCIDDSKIYILEWIHEQIMHKPWAHWKVELTLTEQDLVEVDEDSDPILIDID